MDSRPILIVEDHQETLGIMLRLVRARGFKVLSASSLAEARQIAASKKIGFVISDIGLGDGDACGFMRELSERFGLKGVAITGFGMDADLARTRQAGFILHLTKPIQVSDLERALVLARREIDHPA